MENPIIIYRINNGCTFEDRTEALHESVQNAAYDLMDLLRKENYVKDGADLLGNRKEIKRFIRDLSAALDGKHITHYRIEE